MDWAVFDRKGIYKTAFFRALPGSASLDSSIATNLLPIDA